MPDIKSIVKEYQRKQVRRESDTYRAIAAWAPALSIDSPDVDIFSVYDWSIIITAPLDLEIEQAVRSQMADLGWEVRFEVNRREAGIQDRWPEIRWGKRMDGEIYSFIVMFDPGSDSATCVRELVSEEVEVVTREVKRQKWSYRCRNGGDFDEAAQA